MPSWTPQAAFVQQAMEVPLNRKQGGEESVWTAEEPHLSKQTQMCHVEDVLQVLSCKNPGVILMCSGGVKFLAAQIAALVLSRGLVSGCVINKKNYYLVCKPGKH